MGELLLVLIVIFWLVNASQKKKGNPKTAQSKAAQGAAPGRQAARPKVRFSADKAEAILGSAGAALREVLEKADAPQAEPRAAVSQGEPMLADDDCGGGSMAHAHTEGVSALEDEDCVGGSMAHNHTEGVSRADHARRMAAIDAGHDSDDDVLPETIDARALRRAVVMAEVLGKPRAMRRL